MQAGNSTGHIDAGVPHSPERSDLPVSAAVPKPVAVSAQQQPPLTPPLPRLGSAAEILQQRLAEIYALRRWQAPAATSAAERGATLLPTTQPDAGNDLTAFAEKQFSPGFSSLLPGSHGPKPSGA
jgi:hypothetical protein